MVDPTIVGVIVGRSPTDALNDGPCGISPFAMMAPVPAVVESA